MGIFDLFRSKPSVPLRDYIWMSKEAKFKGYLGLVKQYPDAVWVSWFSSSVQELERFFQAHNVKAPSVHLIRSVSPVKASGKIVVVLEHYPVKSKEDHHFLQWNAKEVLVLSSLDEPLFMQFGGERTIDLMKKLGLKDDEHLEHAMISKSIQNAQRKLEKKVGVEMTANSSEEWFKKNVSHNQV